MIVETTVTVSGDLIIHARQIYKMALKEIASGRVVREGINGYTHHALPAYIVTVAAAEAFTNEVFFGPITQMHLKDWPLQKLPRDWLEKVELSKKLLLLPQLSFGKSFSRDTQPYQDMHTLIKIRNDFVHYKMHHTPPRYLEPLERRHIALASSYPWPHRLSTSEGVRWAHNTACKTVHEMVSFITAESYRESVKQLAANFAAISDSYPREWLKERGIDPDSST